MLWLRAINASGDTSAYWDWHIEQERQRNHLMGIWQATATLHWGLELSRKIARPACPRPCLPPARHAMPCLRQAGSGDRGGARLVPGDPWQLLERDFQAEIRAPALAAITG
jgi:hypothetical protein